MLQGRGHACGALTTGKLRADHPTPGHVPQSAPIQDRSPDVEDHRDRPTPRHGAMIAPASVR